MTVKEIKDIYSMSDIVERYGLHPNRAGFIPCPFHSGDRQASLKVYDKDFHCHACGAHGDIFTFVERMDDLTFRDAFESLGGGYEQSFSARMKVYHAKKHREAERREQRKEEEKKQLNYLLISVYRGWLERLEPLSDEWCSCQNELVKQIGLLEKLNGLR